MTRHSRLSAFLGGLLLSSAAGAQTGEDALRHLEDAQDARTRAFLREQAAQARAALDRIPGRDELLARIRSLSRAETTVSDLAAAGTRLFYLKRVAGSSAPVLCVRDSLSDTERVLVDPVDHSASAAGFDWFVPSPDGRHVAFGLPAGGADSVLRVVAVQGARLLPLQIARTRFNRELAWHPDGQSFYYARVPDASVGHDANIRIYRHVLGRDASRDEVVFAPGVGGARDVPEHVRPWLHLPTDSRYAYAVARDGVRREIAVHVALQKDLAGARPRWYKLAGHEDEVLAILGWRDDLYLLSKRNAPRHRVLRVRGNAPNLAAARAIVPQGDAVIEAMALARDALYLKSTVGGVERLERVPTGLLGARAPEFLRIPFDTAISELVAHPRMAGAIVRLQGWIEPPVIAQVDARSGELRRTALQPASSADFSAMDEVRLYAPTSDGAKVPVTLIYRKSTRLTGDNPVMLLGHGSYGASLAPTFGPARLAWLERGGILAIAHLRGGGEYGEAWHQAGKGANKINTVRDFIAVSEFLLGYGFTSARRLGIAASGAGAVPVGGALVRRPELYAAAVLQSPLADMLRYESGREGPESVPEFGAAASPEGREALRAISPYHQVRERTVYPAVLLTATLDGRGADAWHAAKLAARLQQVGANGYPVLLRVDSASDGAGGTRDEELADIYAFLLWQMGDPRFAVPVELPGPLQAGPAAPRESIATPARDAGDAPEPGTLPERERAGPGSPPLRP